MKISIIIPVYNERKYLKDCIKSIINQSISVNKEIILIDDGSNNGAENDCDRFCETFKDVQVIHKKNEGLSAARVSGINVSKGDWVMFMDHDDTVSPFILEYLSRFTDDPEVDIISGGRIDTSDPNMVKWTFNDHINIIKDNGRNITERIPSDKGQSLIVTPLWGKLFRKSFLNSIDLNKYKLSCPTIFFEDVLMTPILFSKAHKVCLVDEKVYIHREVSTSISRSGILSSFYFEQISSGDILLKYCKENGLRKYFHYEIAIYLRTLLRIYILMDLYLDENELNYNQVSIRGLFLKYFPKSLFNEYFPFKYKLSALLFLVSPRLFKYISKKAYQ